MNEKRITIFTPTFNREKELHRLYASLVKQTCYDFVWLVVDDGSTDNTRATVNYWVEKAPFTILYYYQNNSGKSMAHNQGVRLTHTELFTCVDSDDFLKDNAIERIIAVWDRCKTNDVGILAKREVTVTSKTLPKDLHTTLRNASRKYGIKGDTMLIFNSEVIKRFSFPQFVNEKFVPENYLYDLIDQEGTLYFINEVLYGGAYLDDGYTNNMANTLKKNPKGYLAYISQRISFDKSMADIIPDIIRYIAMSIYAEKKNYRLNEHPFLSIMLFPLGFLFYYIRYRD